MGAKQTKKTLTAKNIYASDFHHLADIVSVIGKDENFSIKGKQRRINYSRKLTKVYSTNKTPTAPSEDLYCDNVRPTPHQIRPFRSMQKFEQAIPDPELQQAVLCGRFTAEEVYLLIFYKGQT